MLYLSALRGVQVRGAYYGLLRSASPLQPHKGAQPPAARTLAPDALNPFLDLRPLLELPRWLHALETLRETGSTIPLAEALRAGPESQSTRKVAGELCRLSEAYLSGLPLELGRQAGRLLQSLKPLRRLLRDDHRLPLADELAERISDMTTPVALQQSSTNAWKRQITLSADELKRQARVIDNLLQHGNVATALGLMNEWTASWAVWCRDRNADWLDYANVRRSTGNLLRAIAEVAGDPELRGLLTEDQRALGEFWRELSDLRNAYAHHGMRPQSVVGDPKVAGQLERIRGFWKKTLRACPNYTLSLGVSPGSRVLVSPVGQRPGVLFSALRTCLTNGPTEGAVTCLAICSPDTEKLIPDAVSRAGHTGRIEALCLDDPYGGTTEISGLASAAQRHFIGAQAVFVNVTGGTTLMGLAADALAATARRLARPVRRFGLIDRRPPDQQDADPYKTGEPFWLDEPADGE